MSDIKLMELDKKEIKSQIEYIMKFVDAGVDDWYWKSEIHDELEHLMIMLKQKGVLD